MPGIEQVDLPNNESVAPQDNAQAAPALMQQVPQQAPPSIENYIPSYLPNYANQPEIKVPTPIAELIGDEKRKQAYEFALMNYGLSTGALSKNHGLIANFLIGPHRLAARDSAQAQGYFDMAEKVGNLASQMDKNSYEGTRLAIDARQKMIEAKTNAIKQALDISKWEQGGRQNAQALGEYRNAHTVYMQRLADLVGDKTAAQVAKDYAAANKAKAEAEQIAPNAANLREYRTGMLRNSGMNANAHVQSVQANNAHLKFLESNHGKMTPSQAEGHLNTLMKTGAEYQVLMDAEQDPAKKGKWGQELKKIDVMRQRIEKQIGLPVEPPHPAGTAIQMTPTSNLPVQTLQGRPGQLVQPPSPNAPLISQAQTQPPTQRHLQDLIKRAKAGDRQAKAEAIILLHQFEQRSNAEPSTQEE